MEYVLEMKDISKTFPGVVALDHVQLQVRPGEVHALMGENGAGKSTLMKILMGIYTKDPGGEILFDGKPYHVSNPKEAMDMGVAMIHQELNPILDMTVYENIFVGRELRKNGLVDKNAEIKEAERLIQECGLHVSAKETLRNLTVAQCQLIEIIKAISVNAKVIVMDEPTAAITEREVELLFEHIRRLTAKGVAIIYISHRMAEIFSICDRVSVYRDGQYIGTGDTSELDEAQLIKMMVGREITDVYPKLDAEIGDVIFEAKNIVRADKKVKGVSLSVRRGEILGICGLVGAGRSELVEGHLRYPSALQRRDLRQGQAGEGACTAGYHQRGCGADHRGPEGHGPEPERHGQRQYRHGGHQEAADQRTVQQEQGPEGLSGIHRKAEYQNSFHQPNRRQSVRRQPAEDRHCQMAAERTGDHHSG